MFMPCSVFPIVPPADAVSRIEMIRNLHDEVGFQEARCRREGSKRGALLTGGLWAVYGRLSVGKGYLSICVAGWCGHVSDL